MYIKKLSVLNFKNYDESSLTFGPKMNCFTGLNGVGKTNILDAIHYLSLCKSYFNPIDSQNIKHEQDFFVIQGEYERNEQVEHIYCAMKRNKKKLFKRNDIAYKKLSEHIGLIPVVMISPSDNRLILDGSEERRNFMNGVIAQYDKVYLDTLIRYNYALAQRNQLLKNFARSSHYDAESIELWDEQLLPAGEKIHGYRSQFLKKILPLFQKYYNYIADGMEKVEMVYQSDLNQPDFREVFKGSLEKDRILQYTTKGVHKDDLLLNLEGHPIKKTGSQGQQKTFLVSLKFAKFDYIKENNGNNPILLLDDIFDKFDASRVEKIINLVSDNNFGQIFITDTNKKRLESILTKSKIDFRIFTVENDTIHT